MASLTERPTTGPTPADPAAAFEGSNGSGRPILDVQGLNVEFLTSRGWLQVIDDVSFQVHPGEVLGIVGESGSGKSVTNLAVMGLLPRGQSRVRAERVELNGRDLLALRRREIEDVRGRDVAMIFQEPMTSLNPAFTVGNQIAETVRRHRKVSRKEAWRAAIAALDAVGIPNAERRAEQYPHEFSGGMRQRVMIAIATCCQPSLLIADEPTTALDVTIQAQILDLLKQMRDELGMALVFITHDLGVVADICDRVMVMYAGQIVERSDVMRLYAEPEHPYTDALLRAMPDMTGDERELEGIPGIPPMAGDLPTGCRFHPRCEHVADGCATTEPALVTVEPGRAVRCLRHNELDFGRRGGA